MHKACQILSTITNQGHSQPSQLVYSPSSHILLTFPSSTLPFHNISSSVPPIYSIYGTFETLHNHYWCNALPCCFWSTAKEVTPGFLIIPVGVKAQSSVKSHLLYSCLRCLKGLFTLTPSPSSCEVIHPSMTTMSVFMQLPVISAFISGVHCVLNASKTSIPCFLRSTPGPVFHITNNQSFVISMVI